MNDASVLCFTNYYKRKARTPLKFQRARARIVQERIIKVDKVRYPDSMKKSLPSLKHPVRDSFNLTFIMLGISYRTRPQK